MAEDRSALLGGVTDPRRFPPPWSVEETDACFIVRDANGQALASVYFEDEPGRRAAAHLLTRDEARRIAEHVARPRITRQPDWQGLPPLIIAEEYLKRALPYRDQAIKLPDTVNSQPNWPKHFLMTHAMELAIKAYIVFATGQELRSHDLLALYGRAVQNGLERNEVVSTGLSQLNDLHMVHYARFPNPVVRPVPVYISGYDDMVDQLLADVRKALRCR
jgi:HEPN domain-containing protein